MTKLMEQKYKKVFVLALVFDFFLYFRANYELFI